MIPEGRLTVEWYGEKHLDQLRDLYRACYPAEEWLPEDFVRFVTARRPGGRNVGKILTGPDGTVYGSVLYTLTDTACVIRRLAVWPDFRRRGLGSYVLNSLCGPTALLRRKTFAARARSDNLDAILFLTRFGFKTDPAAARTKTPDGAEYHVFTYRK